MNSNLSPLAPFSDGTSVMDRKWTDDNHAISSTECGQLKKTKEQEKHL